MIERAAKAAENIHDTDLPAVKSETALIKTATDKIGSPAGANVSADIAAVKAAVYTIDGITDNVIADTQIRRIAAGIKAIGVSATKYLSIDSGTKAEIEAFAEKTGKTELFQTLTGTIQEVPEE